MKMNIRDDFYQLIIARAKREGKKPNVLLDELLGKVLWNEPGLLFKGKKYLVSNDLFSDYEPAENEIEN